MAPERMRGEDVPAGDIWSLGLVLVELLTGAPVAASGADTRALASILARVDAAIQRAPADRHAAPALVDLVGRMLSGAPETRPEAVEVEQACRWFGEVLSGPSLRDWAMREVPRIASTDVGTPTPDALIGRVLVEHSPPMSRRPARAATWILVAGGLVTPGVAALLLLAGLLPALPVRPRPSPTPEPAAAVTAELEPLSAPDPAPRPDPPLALRVAPPRPQPAAPAEIRASPPVVPPAVPTSTWHWSGAAEVWLEDPLGVRLAAGPVVPGSWAVFARFDDGPPLRAAQIEVAQGEQVVLACSALRRDCRRR
jgi:hypothetical protein